MNARMRSWCAVLSAAALGMLVGCDNRSEAPSQEREVQPAAPVLEPTSSVAPPVVQPSPAARLEDERNTMAVFRTVAPATVFVTQSEIVRDWSMRALEVPAGTGTGLIWDKQGHVVTNFHVVDPRRRGASNRVTLHNQKAYEATFVGGEPRKDIAVLKIDAPAEELVAIQLLPEGEEPEVGQKAVAIGNPFGLDHTLTTGVISAVGREVPGYGGVSIRDMIQTDASINPGNSGGPLLDSGGRLIGINTMIYSGSGVSAGIGFAVPVSTVRRIVPQIIEHGRVQRVGLGIQVVPDRVAKRAGVRGVAIARATPGSAAEAAGLEGLRQSPSGHMVVGDVIVGINEHEVHDYDDLYNALDRYEIGTEVTVHVMREGKKRSVKVKLTEID